jgi:hypothetical protein
MIQPPVLTTQVLNFYLHNMRNFSNTAYFFLRFRYFSVNFVTTNFM